MILNQIFVKMNLCNKQIFQISPKFDIILTGRSKGGAFDVIKVYVSDVALIL